MSLLTGFEHIVRENEPLAPYTCLKIGGTAQYFSEPTNRDELIGLVKRFAEAELPVRLLGSGTNLLVPDDAIGGLVIHLSSPEFSAISVEGNRLTAGGGTKLTHFVSTAVREGLSGPEQLVGLPGTIGGALHNNSGAHGVDIGTWVESAEVLTRAGEVHTRERDSMSFSYHQSSLTELVILSAVFQFENESPDSLTKEMQKLWIVRRASQPSTNQNAAYMFKDVGGETASSLIEQAGLKGTQVGKVSVADSDPNFLVAQEGASGKEAIELIEKVKEAVELKTGVSLETAIQIW